MLPAAWHLDSSKSFAKLEEKRFSLYIMVLSVVNLDCERRQKRRSPVVAIERVGLVEALTRLVDASRAELLARMDADDYSYPTRLAEQVQLLDARAELGLVGCLVRCFPRAELTEGMRRYERWQNSLVEPNQIARDIYVESPFCHPSVVMRKSAYALAGGYLDDGRGAPTGSVR